MKSKMLGLAGAFGLFLLFTAGKNLVVKPAAVKMVGAVAPTAAPTVAALLA